MLGVPMQTAVRKTENGRLKVALGANKGLMEWIRLSEKGGLASARLPFVTQEELMKHDKRDDCWIVLFGVVYDVTKYLEFHPGGVEELMRVAGRHAAPLFQDYHSWVNYDNMLKACVVGPFRGSMNKLKKPEKAVLEVTTNKTPEVSLKEFDLHLTSDSTSITVDSTSTLKLLYHHHDVTHLQLVVRVGPNVISLKFPPDVTPIELPNITVTETKTDSKNSLKLLFEKTLPYKINGLTFNKELFGYFFTTKVEQVRKLTPTLHLFTVSLSDRTKTLIPLGHHVHIRVRKGNNRLHKPYTPIWTKSDKSFEGRINFIIRIYDDGVLTPVFKDYQQGTEMEISSSTGSFEAENFVKLPKLVCLTAGTGITAVTNILTERLNNGFKSDSLVFFNRSEQELPDLADILPFNLNQVDFQNVLSEPSESWKGKKGRVDQVMESVLADAGLNLAQKWTDTCGFLVCGPVGFNRVTQKKLNDLSVPPRRVWLFE